VFYDEARFPVSNVVGAIDEGWAVTLTTLSFERGTAFIAEQMRLDRVVRDLVVLAGRVPSPTGRGAAIDSDAVRQELGWMIASVESLRAMTYHLVSKATRTDSPIPDGSMTRAWFSVLSQQVARLAFELRGWASLEETHGGESRDWNHEYFWSFQETIGGGTLEIQKNIVGDRLLGLPKG
jgi:alkylation response protein AidB-like acyl-CoA dehydrogenase